MANNIPDNLHYSKDHEWIKVDGDTATVGITDYAQHSLGDVVYIDLPRSGDKFEAHEALGFGRIGQSRFGSFHADCRRNHRSQ